MSEHTHPLARVRSAKGLSQAALAELVGCRRWMINRIEAGKRTPSPQLASRLQDETGIDARILLGIQSEAA
jgi:ribosome-binding protein aMBF1 (putative translation factor)